MMTLGLACEKAQGQWDGVSLEVTHEDVYSLAGTDSSHIALQEGEHVPLTDALYATMMASVRTRSENTEIQLSVTGKLPESERQA